MHAYSVWYFNHGWIELTVIGAVIGAFVGIKKDTVIQAWKSLLPWCALMAIIGVVAIIYN